VSEQIAKAEYRPEIQGLRAVAALLVATYHIWFHRVSGAVDVFIVVSAFLITTSLLRQIDSAGRVDFVAFWGGLIRRLIPAAFLVLFAVAIATILWMPRYRWIGATESITASGLYLENWLLAFRSVDYLAPRREASPLQHFWALSVQGQLYVLWPILLSVFAVVATRARARTRAVAFIGFAAVFAVSLAYSVYSTRVRQPFAYFDTMARAWEFSLGALLAIALPWIRWSRAYRIAAGWVGLLALLACGIVLQVSRVFPGYAALWPTVAAVLIVAAHDSGSRFGADRLLSTRALTSLGDSSYGIYLWHWPLYIFFQIWTDNQNLGFAEGLVVIGSAIVLAMLTTRWIENPIRYSALGRRGRTGPFLVGAACAVPLIVLMVSWSTYAVQARKADGRVLAVGDPDYPGAAVLERVAWQQATLQTPNVPVHPGPLAVKSDRPSALRGTCFQNQLDAEPLSCAYGAVDASRVIAVVGGSYAAHWIPALRRMALANDWKIVTYTKNRCVLSSDVEGVIGREYDSCEQWNEHVMRELIRSRPKIVLTTATIGSGADEHVPQGYIDQWRILTAAGIDVIAIRNTPHFPFDVPDCVTRHGRDSRACLQPRAALLAPISPTRALEGKLPRVYFVDLTRYFCDERACPPVVGNLLVYSDDSHITTHYARTLAPMLWRELTKLPTELSAEHRDSLARNGS
jgi:peptidoglycan/LPS O-acetylase OafA/YrhL